MNASLSENFKLPTSPSAGSPIGKLMVRIHAEVPATPFEEARAVAHRQLEKAQRCRVFRAPKTPVQEAAGRASLAAFRARIAQSDAA